MNEIEVTGFEIEGFRSFFEDPQRIHPLSKITVLAGPNNSGKSNIFRFASTWLAPRSRKRTLGELDTPILPDGTPVPPFGFGFSVDCANIDDFVYEQYGTALPVTGFLALKAVFEHSAMHDPETNSLWFRFHRDGDNVSISTRYMEKIAQDMGPRERDLSVASSHVLRTASNGLTNVTGLVGLVGKKLKIPEVIVIPAFREIISSGNPGPTLENLGGKGLPGFLHALHSPSAERYRIDARKFQQINRFLKTVLEEESAEIAIPYNSETIHVSVRDRVLPIESLGSGISQVIMLAAVSTWHEDKLVCIEEPEVHLHPVLLRKLALFLQENTNNRYLLSTHSASLMDNPDVSVIRIEYTPEHGTKTETAVTENHRAHLTQSLGYRASDILQSNSIIWVEGPSDRIYVNRWIQTTDPHLIEGVHYSVMFYGGKLLSHLSGGEYEAPENVVDDFISLIKINRRMAIILDSDLKREGEKIRGTKQRVIDGFAESGGLAWLTEGREIENYVPHDIFSEAATSVHATADPKKATQPFGDMFLGVKRAKGSTTTRGVVTPDKVAIAVAATAESDEVWPVMDLRERVQDLVTYIRESNQNQTWVRPKA